MRRAHCLLWNGLLILALAHTAFAQDANSDSLNRQADEAYRNRNFPAAIQLCDSVLAQNAEDHVALYLRGSSRVELGILNGNLEMLRQGISDSREAIRHEGTGKPEYYLPYIYGMSHLSALEGKKTHAQTAITVADSVLERGNLDDEQRANLLYQRAQAQVQLSEYPAAGADLNEVLKLSPNHLAAYMLNADVVARSKSPAEAVAAYGRVVQSFPDNPLAYNNRGMYLQSINRPAEAIADFNKAIQLDSKFIPAYINRGFAYLEAGDAAQAESALTQALAVDPGQLGAISLRATARLNQNKSADAIADYKKVVELAPQSPMAHADLGFAQFFTGDYRNAHDSFNRALQIDSKLRFLQPWKLACEIRTGQVDQAAYQSSLTKAKDNRDWIDSLIQFELGRIGANELLQSVHPTDKAASDAQQCEGYYFIGMELQRRGNLKDAVGYWKQAAQNKLPKLSAYRGALFALNNAESATR